MNSIESFTTTTTIISILISLATIWCTTSQAVHQTRVTESLNTHDNQVKYRLYRGIYFCFLVFIIVASIQFSGSVILDALSKTKDNDSVKTEQVIEDNASDEFNMDLSESELETAESKDEDSETIEKKHTSLSKYDIIIILIEVVVFIVCCAITWKCFYHVRKKNKENLKFWKEMLGMISTVLSFWAIINIILLDFSIKLNFWVIVISAFIIYDLAKASYDSITKSDWFPAKIKTKHKGKELYIYEMKDEFLLTGTDRYLCNCEEFYLIHAGEIKSKIINSYSDIEMIEEDTESEKEIEVLKKKIKELEYEIIDIKGLAKKNEKHSIIEKIRDFFCI